MVASGTVTLQAAHFGVPMVIFYRASALLYRLLRGWLIRTPYLSLVNILARAQHLPHPLAAELMPWASDAGRLAQAALDMLADPSGMIEQRRRLLELVVPLRSPDGPAAENVAEMVLEHLK